MTFHWNWAFTWEILPRLLHATVNTLLAAGIGYAIALVLGLVLALAQRTPWKPLTLVVRETIEFIRSTPLVLQIFFVFYVGPQFGIRLSPWVSGMIAIGLHYSAYLSEVYRAGIEAVSRGLIEGQTFEVVLRAIGMCPGPADTLQCQALTCVPPDLSAAAVDASCAGQSNGSVTLSTTSGSGTLTFELDGQTNNSGIFSGLAPGLYVASMTDGANCPANIQFTIAAPQAMGLAVSLTDSVACFGQSNGSATGAVTGGTANYTFDWDNGEASATATQLDAGSHTVTVTGMAGCAAESDIVIPQPAVLSLSVNTTGAGCPGGRGSRHKKAR